MPTATPSGTSRDPDTHNRIRHDRIVNAFTGELLRELILDPERDYQGQNET